MQEEPRKLHKSKASRNLNLDIANITHKFGEISFECEPPTPTGRGNKTSLSFFSPTTKHELEEERDKSSQEQEFPQLQMQPVQQTQLQAQSNGGTGGTCGIKRTYSQREHEEEMKDDDVVEPPQKRFQR